MKSVRSFANLKELIINAGDEEVVTLDVCMFSKHCDGQSLQNKVPNKVCAC